jgi:hypothetical protein
MVSYFEVPGKSSFKWLVSAILGEATGRRVSRSDNFRLPISRAAKALFLSKYTKSARTDIFHFYAFFLF